MPELTEAELADLQGAKVLLDKLVRDPKTKRQAERLIKVHHPEVVTLDDNESELRQQLVDLQKQVEDDRNARAARDADHRLESEYGALRKDGWTDEGLEKLKKFQVERQIASPLDAAGAWDRAYPKPKEQVSPLAPTDWGFGKGEEGSDTRMLFEDEDRWAEKEAKQAWSDAVKERIET